MTDPDGVTTPRQRLPEPDPASRSSGVGPPNATPRPGPPPNGSSPANVRPDTPNGPPRPEDNGPPGDDASTVPEYPDLAEVSGRPIGEIAYWIALALAAGADVAAFHQVIALVMRRQQDWLIWAMVVGFTAAALTLAHFSGRILRDISAGRPSATKGQVAACLVPWTALGIVAFTVRLTLDDPSGSTFGGLTVDNVAIGGIAGTNQRLASALMFLGLYVASGAVAGVGAYLTRSPKRVGYRHALRAHERALRRLSRSQPPYERAIRVMQLQEDSRRSEEQNWQAARAWRIAYAEAMKRYAAVLIAAQQRDPSVISDVTRSERRSMLPAPSPPPITPPAQPRAIRPRATSAPPSPSPPIDPRMGR